MSLRRSAKCIAAGAAFALSGEAATASVNCAADRALLTKADGSVVSIKVEVADDPAERARGLMWRDRLAPQSGMLFIYEEPRLASFWMKNTLISLDLLFFDSKGVLRHVHPEARPKDLTPIPGAVAGDPDPNRMYILEIAGGQAAKLGLNSGAILSHPAIPENLAKAPCR